MGQGACVITEGREFISEPFTPDPGTFDTAAMARGQHGLPTGFTWRGEHYEITRLVESWKHSEAEFHTSGERYYRKHFFHVETDQGDAFIMYALRKVKSGENTKKRWWIYERIPPPSPSDATTT